MTRRTGSILLGLLLAAPLGAQVGHTPDSSPFEDLRGRQGLTLAVGSVAPGGDPAGVGPRTGMQFSARYELLLTGPLWFQTRATYAPGLERTYKDPILAEPQRDLGTSRRPLVMLEGGFGLNLTGNKAWHRIVPQVHGGLGWAYGGTSQFDPGGYRFGNRFMLSYGVGARIVTGREWELHADLTHFFWKYTYPDDYAGDDDAILPNGPLGPWKGNALLSVGMTRFFFR